jgi:hypothetical protein
VFLLRREHHHPSNIRSSTKQPSPPTIAPVGLLEVGVPDEAEEALVGVTWFDVGGGGVGLLPLFVRGVVAGPVALVCLDVVEVAVEVVVDVEVVVVVVVVGGGEVVGVEVEVGVCETVVTVRVVELVVVLVDTYASSFARATSHASRVWKHRSLQS